MKPHKERTLRSDHKRMIQIVGIYLLVGFLWIVASDILLSQIAHERLHVYEILKGWFYVSLTGMLLYFLIRKYLSEIVAARRLAQENEAHFREIYNHLNDGIVVFSITADGALKYAESNEVFHRMTGYAPEELSELEFEEYFVETKGSTHAMNRLFEEGQMMMETLIVSKEGTVLPVEVNAKISKLKQGNVILSVFRDIRERNQAEETIRYLAYHDRLTDLYNAHYFYDALQQRLQNELPFTILLIAINRFDEIQDGFGREKSLQLIRNLSERLLRHVREPDLLARTYNHAFHMLIPEVEMDAIEEKLSFLKQEFRLPFALGEDELSPDISIGVARYPHDGLDADALTQHTDRSLYLAFEKGAVYLTDEAKSIPDIKYHLLLENDLKKAVERNQFQLLFQPKMNVATGRVAGMEALIRWHHARLGTISPGEFITLAEKSGLIVPIGKWVLREACRYAKSVHELHGTPIPVSVNISIRQFLQNDFIPTVQEALTLTGLDARYLMLEITESMTMKPEAALEILNAMKRLGVRISIDDFGTGFSSFSYLKKFPIDELKIDKSFIDDLLNDPAERNIVKTIISLAHDLRLKVVAEGVETRGQLECLQRLGCDEVQGYWYARPMEFDRLADFLRANQPA